MNLLAVDAGTTHCKAGLFSETGELLALALRPTPQRKTGTIISYDPDELWQQIVAAISEITVACAPRQIAALGLSSMAETGLLLSRDDGSIRTAFLPWFDTRTVPQAEQLARATDVGTRFLRTGMRPTFKCATARLLWLRAQNATFVQNSIWLSVADYLAYRLSGAVATDYSLAGRTYAFLLGERRWDVDWMREWELDPELFPPAMPAGAVVGHVTTGVARALGVASGIPVTIAGHDHVCAAFAAGAVRPGIAFDSMGTAETLVGALPARQLDGDDFNSGFTFGYHAVPDTYYWMGGLSTSGGSVEWLRHSWSDPPLSYEALQALVDELPPQPTGILFFPYLAGSGAPHRDDQMRGAFAGLHQDHGRAHLIKAVLEGTAYEMEWIRRAAGRLRGADIDHIVVAGGGARNRHWLQIKADISDRPLTVMPMIEAALLGAALLAGLAAGVYGTVAEALALLHVEPGVAISPDPTRHRVYRRLFEEGYCALQETLQRIATTLVGE